MLTNLLKLLFALADFVRSEASDLRQGLVRLALACMILMVAGALLVAGFGILLWGVYLALTPALGASGAAFASGAAALVLSALSMLFARMHVR